MKRAIEAKIPEWKNLETRYVPLLSTWLAKRRWEDYEPKPEPKNRDREALEALLCLECKKNPASDGLVVCEACK